jgi:hypothetical protein
VAGGQRKTLSVVDCHLPGRWRLSTVAKRHVCHGLRRRSPVATVDCGLRHKGSGDAMKRIVVGLIGLTLLAAACTGPTATSLPKQLVTQTHSGPNTSTIAVRSRDYRVVVATTGLTWVQSSNTPGQASQTELLQAGQSRTFVPTDGKVSLLLGSAQVKMNVEVDGRVVRGGQLTPTVTPLTMNFSSVR